MFRGVVLVADQEWQGEIRGEKVRVWADDDYRAQNVHWERTFDEEIDYANQVLGALAGIVKAAKGAPHAAVIKVLDHAKVAGLRRMAIATDTGP